MVTISLCLIVKNEESVLARCLDSVRDLADEIVIVDTGSTDKTKEIARKYTGKVSDFEWVNDFSAARNEAFSRATMDYAMWLDADDIVPPESLKRMLALKESLNPDVDIVAMKYLTHFDAGGNPILTSTRERWIRLGGGYIWIDPVHECIPLVGNVLYTDIEIVHKKGPSTSDPNRNIKIYDAVEASGKPMSARQLYYYARELKDHCAWAKAAYYFERFLDGKQGWVEDNIATCFNLSICYNAMGEEHKILPILLRSFHFDAPRAEICSELGYYYKRAKNHRAALQWFNIASNLGSPSGAGFILCDYWGYIPNIEACVCCCELGDFKTAAVYNERAAGFKPDSEAVSINREYLAGLGIG
ncbi:MAG: glycosyltransferase family 2 protein [Oscillospiraceae bacterium]|nr:glycosyltransferase family 2 protein [Oscillospiraceae bacterium]